MPEQKVYFDNSATTPMSPEVLEAMMPHFVENYGNPSSIHAHGRMARSVIEKSRKVIADLLHTSPSEIFFTSGGTEADNTAIFSSINSLGIKHAISSPLEHHAVLHTLQNLEKEGKTALHFVKCDNQGVLDLNHLEDLLQKYPQSFVSIMHANNEIGNLNDIATIGMMCKSHSSIFHTDTVQTMGKIKHDIQALDVNFLVGSAHKFHGPKGVGFLHVSNETKIKPFIHGGAQERNMRGGTENVAGIVGLAKALEVAYRDMEANQTHITSLKESMKTRLQEKIKGITFNGMSGEIGNSLYSVLNVGIPESEENDMLLFNLDIMGISVSGGSACSSGSSIGSHVLTALGLDESRGAIRFSFSKNNTIEEVDYVVNSLAKILG